MTDLATDTAQVECMMVPLSALIDAERRAAAAEARLAILEEQLGSRRKGDRERQGRLRQKRAEQGESQPEAHDSVMSRDTTLHNATQRDPLPPSVSPDSPHTPHITPSTPPRPNTTTVAAADPEGHERLATTLGATGTAELNAFLARLTDDDRRRSWIRRLQAAIDGDGSKAYSAEEISLALGDMNTNGELNRARFLGYLALHRSAQQAPSGTAAGAPGRASGTSRTSARDLEAEGLVIWGELVEGITQQYRANDPNDTGAGGSNVWVLRAPTWDKLDEPAKRAFRAIGGAVAIATATDERKGFLSAQFAKTYAGARMQTAKATAAA